MWVVARQLPMMQMEKVEGEGGGVGMNDSRHVGGLATWAHDMNCGFDLTSEPFFELLVEIISVFI